MSGSKGMRGKREDVLDDKSVMFGVQVVRMSLSCFRRSLIVSASMSFFVKLRKQVSFRVLFSKLLVVVRDVLGASF